jgi:hypothetical protein
LRRKQLEFRCAALGSVCPDPGFGTVDVTPIGEHVFPGWHRALAHDRALFARLPLAGRLPYRLLLNFDARTVYGAFDYVLASARKPTQEGVPNGAA